jgi:glycosyltransferase involved in cell wall biosynthesis
MSRLAIFSHKLFRRTPEGLKTTGGLSIQINALARHFDQINLCVPVTTDANFSGLGADANVIFHPLPHYGDQIGFIRALPKIRRQILDALEHSDLALAILPSYVGILASFISQRKNFPLFQWVVGNWSRNVILRRQSPSGVWLASNILAPILDGTIKWLTRDVVTFYNGKVLYDQGKPFHLTRTSSSIREQDICVREDPEPSTKAPLGLLFVGRISPEKGLSHLLKAVAQLVSVNESVHLCVVGAGSLEEQLHIQAAELNIAACANFLGYVSERGDLLELYREADVFILPSLEDQQPKVLLEAMSQGLPIIATRVGGIPSMIEDSKNGLLVSPADAEAIVEAIKKLKSDPSLRRRLRHAGIAYARNHTVEKETDRMLKIIADYFPHLKITT